VDLLLQYVTANAAEHSSATPSDSTPSDPDAPAADEAEMSILARALRTADPVATPHIAARADLVLSGEPGQRVSWAIHALIAGITTTPTPVASTTSTDQTTHQQGHPS
jgi:hypothetical protein